MNGLLDAKSRRPLPYLQVIPVGKTEPLKVEWVGAFNHALEEPSIRIKFNDRHRSGGSDAGTNPCRACGGENETPREWRARSKSPAASILTQRYKVTISPELKGDRGYGLAAESRWGATFHPKESCLVFPSSQVFARARQELRFAFFQINTPQVTWKLARIPPEKLSAVTARVREFDKDATDPVTGKVVIDPRTGFAKQFQTELLVDAFQLPAWPAAHSMRRAAMSKRDATFIAAPPANEAFAGAYLFEASATLPDGRIVGNRSIICVNDYLLTQKRTPTTVIMRLAKMSDAKLRHRRDGARRDRREHRTRPRRDGQGRHRASSRRIRFSRKRMIPKLRTRIFSSRIPRPARRCNLPKAHRIHPAATYVVP